MLLHNDSQTFGYQIVAEVDRSSEPNLNPTGRVSCLRLSADLHGSLWSGDGSWTSGAARERVAQPPGCRRWGGIELRLRVRSYPGRGGAGVHRRTPERRGARLGCDRSQHRLTPRNPWPGGDFWRRRRGMARVRSGPDRLQNAPEIVLRSVLANSSHSQREHDGKADQWNNCANPDDRLRWA